MSINEGDPLDINSPNFNPDEYWYKIATVRTLSRTQLTVNSFQFLFLEYGALVERNELDASAA